jgi:parallel beta-helix repeat protein
MNTRHALLVLLTAVIITPFTAFSQGSLVPSGAPAPSMKTLEQIEPRTVISSVPYTINQPGSYYLTNNLYGVSSDYGIQIFANNVTVDLNGFTLRGVTNAFDGLVVFQSSSNVTVCNGMISGWGQGNYGIRGLGQHSSLKNLTISGNSFGVSCNAGSIIQNCLITSNQRDGIDLNGGGSQVLNNTIANNNTLGGFGNAAVNVIGVNNRIEGNHVTVNNGGFGIYVFSSTNNIVVKNSVSGAGVNNYSVAPGNVVGPFINSSGTITNLNPWANFSL